MVRAPLALPPSSVRHVAPRSTCTYVLQHHTNNPPRVIIHDDWCSSCSRTPQVTLRDDRHMMTLLLTLHAYVTCNNYSERNDKLLRAECEVHDGMHQDYR